MKILVKSHGMELAEESQILSNMNHEELSDFFWSEVGNTFHLQHGVDKQNALETFWNKFEGSNWESLTKVEIVALGNKATDSSREYIVTDIEDDGNLTYLDLN